MKADQKKYLIIASIVVGVLLLIGGIIWVATANKAPKVTQTIGSGSNTDNSGSDVFNPTQVAGQQSFQTILYDHSGLGDVNDPPLKFSPTITSWTLTYSYTSCRPLDGLSKPTGLGLTLTSGSTILAGRVANGSISGGETLGPFSQTGPMQLRLTTPSEKCSWRMIVTEQS